MVKQARSSHRFNPRRPDNLADFEEDERAPYALFVNSVLRNKSAIGRTDDTLTAGVPGKRLALSRRR